MMDFMEIGIQYRLKALRQGINNEKWNAMPEEKRRAFIDECDEMFRKAAESEKQRRLEEQEREIQERTKGEIVKFDSRIPPRYKDASIDDFSEGNAVIRHILEDGSCLLSGSPGIGKTHLIWACGKELVKKGVLSSSIAIVNLQSLLCDIKENGSDNWSRYIQDKWGRYRYLFIDEYDKIYNSKADYVVISDLISYRYDYMLATIISGNGDSDTAIDILGQATYSRITGQGDKGYLFRLSGEDRRKKKEAKE